MSKYTNILNQLNDKIQELTFSLKKCNVENEYNLTLEKLDFFKNKKSRINKEKMKQAALKKY